MLGGRRAAVQVLALESQVEEVQRRIQIYQERESEERNELRVRQHLDVQSQAVRVKVCCSTRGAGSGRSFVACWHEESNPRRSMDCEDDRDSLTGFVAFLW